MESKTNAITTLRVTVGVRDALHEKKEPGESFDEVLRRTLGLPAAPSDPSAAVRSIKYDLDRLKVDESKIVETEPHLVAWLANDMARAVAREGRRSGKQFRLIQERAGVFVRRIR